MARIYSLMEDAGWHSLRKLLKLEHAASRKLPLREENSLVTDPAAEPETVHGRCVRYSCMPLACHEGLQGSTTPLPDVLLWCPAPTRLALKSVFLILTDLVLGIAPTLHAHPVPEFVAVLHLLCGYLSVARTGDGSLKGREPYLPVIGCRVPAPVIQTCELCVPRIASTALTSRVARPALHRDDHRSCVCGSCSS